MSEKNKDALVEAMYRAVMAPSDKESDDATVIALELAKDMTVGEMMECQRIAVGLITQTRQLDAITEKIFEKPVIH